MDQCKHSCDLMKCLKDLSSILWCCMWNFNEIISYGDKVGGSERHRQTMVDFRECLYGCELRDLPFVGDKFTWNNGQGSLGNIRERIDKVVADFSWVDLFPSFEVRHQDLGL